ncbi:hypothetical protein ACIA03_07960 [Nocardioides sp. NPDC051685]|uniref:hypothetical protein n=1 Tax=Nocardioides sp. NPDC051685 TaxID=3364334 RepID=UPI0037AB64F2
MTLSESADTPPDSFGPVEVRVGAMLLNIADPEPGWGREYNRWYEDDHFFHGAMMAPWVFAGRRWVAPATLRGLQYSRTGGVFDPPGSGRYAGTYWIAPDHLNDYLAWSGVVGPQMAREGRSFSRRQLVFTTFAEHRASVYRDERVPQDVFALMDPPGGLVVQLIDVPQAEDRDDTIEWLSSEYLPSRLAMTEGSARLAMVFQGAAETPTMRPALRDLQESANNGGRRIVLLWFLDDHPTVGWGTQFAAQAALLDASGRAVLEWMTAFIPSHMGTDDYLGELDPSNP